MLGRMSEALGDNSSSWSPVRFRGRILPCIIWQDNGNLLLLRGHKKVGNHPNAFFEASVKFWDEKSPKSEDGKIENVSAK